MRIDRGRQKFSGRAADVSLVVVASIYLGLGVVGLVLAIPPGYASPIFPAAGFAAAIALCSTRQAWIGIWLGSFALNLGVAWSNGDVSWRSGLIAMGIATGSTVQAFVARWWVVRKVGDGWRALETESDVFRSLALAGPAACLVSATVAVTLLYSLDVVSGAAYSHVWFNWWLGDTLGVLVILPISLAILYRRESPWSGRFVSMVVPMLLTLGLVGGAFYAVAYWERSQQKRVIESYGEALANSLMQRFIAHQEALAALRRLIEVTPEMTYRQFEHFTKITLRDNPDIFALSFNPYVTAERRVAFEREMAAKTAKRDFEIKERDERKRLVRAADKSAHVVVGYIAPLEGNRPALGYDINSEPVRREAIEAAIRTDAPAVTAPIRLVQENRERAGVLVLHPARAISAPITAKPSAFAVGVLKVDEMVEIATRSIAVPGLVFHVADVAAISAGASFYRSEATPVSSDGFFSWRKYLAIADRTWSIGVAPTPEYLHRDSHWAALIVGAGGLALAALLQMLLLISTGRTAIVQRKVREQTAELEIARSKAEKASQLLREAVDSIAQGFTIYDENDRLVHCNEAYRRFYEASRDLIVFGARFEDIVRNGAERGQYPAAIGRVDAWVAERVEQHRNANGEIIEQELTDGRWLMIVEFKTPSGYIVGNRIDITERRIADAVIRDSTEQLNAIFALSPDGFVSFDGRHRVKYVSPAFSSLTGLEEKVVTGLDEESFSVRLAALCVPSARFRGIEAMKACIDTDAGGEPPRERIELAGPGNRVIEVSLRVSDAETVSQILYFHDITHETEVNRMKSEFLSTAAHELRTPMASIYGFAEVLLRQEVDEETRCELVEIIYRQSELMANVINELLDIARIEARRGKDFVLETVPIDELVTDAVSGYKVPNGRSMPIVASSGHPTHVRVDRGKMRQAIINLLSNAYKYSPDGGDVRIYFETDAMRGRAGIVVRDQGIGMTPEQLARVCERFYRADTSGKILGTGLGMSIVKEIVELQGGELELASAIGMGTAVTVWIPAVAVPRDEMAT